MIVYSFDVTDKKSSDNSTKSYRLVGWSYSRSQNIQFSCRDSADSEKQYPLSFCRMLREDVNQVLNIAPESEIGFTIDVTLPADADGVLEITDGETAKVSVPLENLHPQYNNVNTSELWKELRAAVELKAEQAMLADFNRRVIYNFDVVGKKTNDNGTHTYNIVGWSLSAEHPVQFTCIDSADSEKQYEVAAEWIFRNDVNEVLDIDKERKLGFSLEITLPADADGVLEITDDETVKVSVPLESLHPQYNNVNTSELWKELRAAVELKAEQAMLADFNRRVIYNFDVVGKKTNDNGTHTYNIVGWSLSAEHPVQFTCIDSADSEKQYEVAAEWIFRNDVNEVLDIDKERKLGFFLEITLPADADGVLEITDDETVKVSVPLENLHPQYNNVNTSELWKELRAAVELKAEQAMLADPSYHVIYNFDMVAQESWNDKDDIYNLAGWCYCDEQPVQFACYDSNDPEKEYRIFVSRNFRSDLNKVLGIRPEYEPGFTLVICLPRDAEGILVMTSGAVKITIPLNQLHQNFSNIGTSELWKELRAAAELNEEEDVPAVSEEQELKDEPFRHSSWGEHLLLVVHFADRTGAPLLALNIAEQLYHMGYNLHIIVLRDGELIKDLSQYAKVYVADLENEEKFGKILSELEPYQIKNAYLNTTVSGFYAKLLKENGYTVVTLVHEMAHTLEEMSLQTAAENTIRYSDRIVIPSTLIKEDWQQLGLYMPDGITSVMPQPDYHFDMHRVTADERKAFREEICRELNLDEDTFLVLGCGTLEERKKTDLFLKTAEKIVEKHSKVCFIWIGDYGSMTYRMKIYALASTLPDNARLLPYQKLNRYFYAADLFFLPSSTDPFPTVALLAAKNSLPIVFCSKSTGIRDLFQEVENCAAQECSVDAFAELIYGFIVSEPLRLKSGEQCAEIYRSKMYSFKEYTSRLFEFGSSVMPRVSCIIPNYNYARFLPERVKNVVQQSYPVYELIILDDCSKDESDSVIQNLMEQYKDSFAGGIRYVKNSKNAGVFRQWLRGAEMAKSDLIWIAEADDCCSELLISKLIHAFTRDPQVRIAYAQSSMLAADGSVTEEVNTNHTADISRVKWSLDYISTAANELENGLSIRNTIPNASALVMNRKALLQVPEKLLKFKVAGDWFAYLHIISSGKVAFCADALNYYRRHEGSVVARNLRRLITEIAEIQRFILDRYDLSVLTVQWMRNEYLRCCTLAHVEPENLDHFDKYIEEHEKEEAFLFIFDEVSSDVLQILRKSAEYFTGSEIPERIFFLCFGHFSLPADYAGIFPIPVHILYYDDLCLYGFERAFFKNNKISVAAAALKTCNIESEHALLRLLTEKVVIATDDAADMEQAESKIQEFLAKHFQK